MRNNAPIFFMRWKMTDFFFFYCSQTASSGSSQTIGAKTFMESDFFPITYGNATTKTDYHKVTSSRPSWIVAHPSIFRLFTKGKFDAYVLWPLVKRVQNSIVDSTVLLACDFTVSRTCKEKSQPLISKLDWDFFMVPLWVTHFRLEFENLM